MTGSHVCAAAVLHQGEKMIPGEITGRPEPGRLGIDFPVDAMNWGIEHSANRFLGRGTVESLTEKKN